MTGNRQRYTTSRFSSSGELLFNSLLDNSLHALSSVFVPFHFASPFFSILSFFSSFLSSLPCLSFSLSPLLLPSLLLLIHSGIFFHRGSERAKTSPICPPSSPPPPPPFSLSSLPLSSYIHPFCTPLPFNVFAF